jgi:hypothetical protein
MVRGGEAPGGCARSRRCVSGGLTTRFGWTLALLLLAAQPVAPFVAPSRLYSVIGRVRGDGAVAAGFPRRSSARQVLGRSCVRRAAASASDWAPGGGDGGDGSPGRPPKFPVHVEDAVRQTVRASASAWLGSKKTCRLLGGDSAQRDGATRPFSQRALAKDERGRGWAPLYRPDPAAAAHGADAARGRATQGEAVMASLDDGLNRIRVQLNLAEFQLGKRRMSETLVPVLMNCIAERLLARGLRPTLFFNSVADASEARVLLREDLRPDVAINVLGLGDFSDEHDVAVCVLWPGLYPAPPPLRAPPPRRRGAPAPAGPALPVQRGQREPPAHRGGAPSACPTARTVSRTAPSDADPAPLPGRQVERIIYAGPPRSITSRLERKKFLMRPIVLFNPVLEVPRALRCTQMLYSTLCKNSMLYRALCSGAPAPLCALTRRAAAPRRCQAVHAASTDFRKVPPMFLSDFTTVYFLQVRPWSHSPPPPLRSRGGPAAPGRQHAASL